MEVERILPEAQPGTQGRRVRGRRPASARERMSPARVSLWWSAGALLPLLLCEFALTAAERATAETERGRRSRDSSGLNCTCPPNATTGAPVERKACGNNGHGTENTYCPSNPAPHQCNPGGCNPPPPIVPGLSLSLSLSLSRALSNSGSDLSLSVFLQSSRNSSASCTSSPSSLARRRSQRRRRRSTTR